MTQQNKNIPSDDNNEFDFNIADFGEPTHETMLAFADTLETLKEAARLYGTVDSDRLDTDPDAEKINGVLNHYTLDIDGGERRLFVNMLDAEPHVMAQIGQELAEQGMYTVFISYNDADHNVSYRQKYGMDPTLYVRAKHDRVERESADTSSIQSSIGAVGIGIEGTPDFMRYMHARSEERAEARKLGLDVPTEGTMKQLVSVIHQELAGLQSWE